MHYGFAAEGLLKIDRIGAGIGIVFFSKAHRVAAGAHMLRGLSPGGSAENAGYYADTAVPALLKGFADRGVSKPFSIALAGAASMLNSPEDDSAGSKLLTVVKQVLAGEGLTIKLEETGGIFLRTILLNVDAGKIKIID